MGYIYIPDNPTTPSGNQPQVIVLPPKETKRSKRLNKKEKLLEKFISWQEEHKKDKEAEAKKKAEASKPRSFSYLEAVGIAMASAIPLAIALTTMLNLFQHAMGNLIGK